MNESTNPHLTQARHGRKGKDRDLFLGFWLGLLTNERMQARPRQTQRDIRTLLASKPFVTACEELGPDRVLAELADGARAYVEAALGGDKYRSAFFGMKRLDDDQVVVKVARDVVDILTVLASVPLEGLAARLPRTLLDGALAAMPGSEATIRATAERSPDAQRLLAAALDD